MPIPTYQDSDVLTQLLALLPSGRAWPNQNRSSNMVQTINATFVPTITNFLNTAGGLIADGFPATTVGLVSNWNLSEGLPDPCQGTAPTLAAEQAQIVARFIGTGGQSISYLIDFADSLGYTITINQFTPFKMGQSCMGYPYSPFSDSTPAFLLQVNVQSMADFLGGNLLPLECELARIAPGQAYIIYST